MSNSIDFSLKYAVQLGANRAELAKNAINHIIQLELKSQGYVLKDGATGAFH